MRKIEVKLIIKFFSREFSELRVTCQMGLTLSTFLLNFINFDDKHLYRQTTLLTRHTWFLQLSCTCLELFVNLGNPQVVWQHTKFLEQYGLSTFAYYFHFFFTYFPFNFAN